MDPNATLAQIRATREAMNSRNCTRDQRAILAGDLVVLIGNLDSWLSNGGFLPSDWAR